MDPRPQIKHAVAKQTELTADPDGELPAHVTIDAADITIGEVRDCDLTAHAALVERSGRIEVTAHARPSGVNIMST